ncbi:MAG: hypothetical protein JXQ73_17995 [Phycisphaerae bacterium]|nr:hypothetical protein [Phycisphaerae bacterium]
MPRRALFPLKALVLVCTLAPIARGEILVQDTFTAGFEEPNWDFSWNRGVGSSTVDANAPGFAHLNLNGPAPAYGTIYHNAELINRNMTYRVPVYCDLEIRLRNSNNNGHDSPGGPNDPDPNYGIGSRGWGLWNSSMDPLSKPMNTIWFSSISPQSDPLISGTRLWVVKQNIPYAFQDLNIDLTEWHTYRIKWRPDHLAAYVDDMSTPIWESTSAGQIPDVALNFTVWVDNYLMTMPTGFPNFVIGYLDVPAIQQYIDVDYVRIYTQERTLTLDMVNGSWGTVLVEPNYPAYAEGTPVTLTAEPIEGKSLRHWQVYDPNFPDDANHAAEDTNNPLVVTMDADQHVTAVFKCGSSGMALLPVVVVVGGMMEVRREK